MRTAVGPQGEAKEEADGENTAIGNSEESEKQQQQQKHKEEEELDKMSLLVLWYGENQESPMYSLIRQSSFTAYEEGIAKGESLVPIVKRTLLRKTPDSDDTTVVCSAGYEGDEETTPGGDGSGSSDPTSTSRIKPKRGSIEDFMAAGSASSSSSKNNKLDKQQQDMVEVALLREDSDAFDGVDDRGADHSNCPRMMLLDQNQKENDKTASAGRFSSSAEDDDKEDDHDDIEVLWKEQEETSDGSSSGGLDDLIKQVMDKFLVEVKVEQEWNHEQEEPAAQEDQDDDDDDDDDEQQQDDKYAVVKVRQPAEKKTESDAATLEQQEQQQEQEEPVQDDDDDDDENAVSDVTMDPFNQEEEDDDDDEQQEDRYAVKANPSERQENVSTLENDPASHERAVDVEDIPKRVDGDSNNNIEAEMEATEGDEVPAGEVVSEMAVEEEVIFMSHDSSEDADEQQQKQDVLKADAVAGEDVEQLVSFGLESSTKTSTNFDEYDQEIRMFSTHDHSADADEEVAAIVEPGPEVDENKTPSIIKKEFEKIEVKPTTNSIYSKVILQRSLEIKMEQAAMRRSMEIKMAQAAQVAQEYKQMQRETTQHKGDDEDVQQAIIPQKSAIEIQAAKDQAMANQVKSALDEAMEHRDVWYDMSLTSRDESIVQEEEDHLSTSGVIPPPLSPWTDDSDMTSVQEESCNRVEEGGTLSPVNFEGDCVNEGPFQIMIEGAGTPEVNGVYQQDGYYGSACRYSKRGQWKGGSCMFYLCQCTVHDGRRRWFLSLVPDGCPVVTGYFYSAPVTKACRHIPPLQGWDKAVHGQKPRPTLSYRSKLAEENIKLSAEKQKLEYQNEALSEELNELKATFKQRKEASSKEKETWEQQQKDYEHDLLKQRDQMEQNLKDIDSIRATVVDYECKEQKLKAEIESLRSAATAHQLQLKLVLQNQALQLEMAQYESKDPEELMAQTKALLEKVNQYKQQEQEQEQAQQEQQQQQHMKTNNCAKKATAFAQPSSPPPRTPVQIEAVVTTEKGKNMICLPHPLM
jgi:hypothetical protein